MSDYIPEDILIQILLKLPVKSIIRFTSVCKEWRCLIRSPSFISTHLSNTTQKHQALFQCYDYQNRREHYMAIPKRGPLVINSDSGLEFPFKCRIGYFRIVGSCDGLVCVSDDYKIIVWNPAIRNHLVLPQPQSTPNHEYHFVVLGFGVATHVYKVVRLVYRRNPDGNGYIFPPQAEIFCLGTRTWRNRKMSGFDHVRGLLPKFPRCPIFFEGFVHWIGYDPIGRENSQRTSILTFHVGDEVFGEIMLPHELGSMGWATLGTRMSLSRMGEKLGAFKIDEEVDNPRCDVWMMKKYGVKESWTKLYTIDTVGYLRVIGFRGSDEALLTVDGCELVSYNPETKGIKHVANNRNMWSFYMDDYKESLVSSSEVDIVETRGNEDY